MAKGKDHSLSTTKSEERLELSTIPDVELTLRDRTAFVEALPNPPGPNAKLRKAIARHAVSVTR